MDAMESIMTTVFHESEEISSDLLRPLLESVRKENQVTYFVLCQFQALFFFLGVLFYAIIYVFVIFIFIFKFSRPFHLLLGHWARKLLPTVLTSSSPVSWKQ